jgi:putative SOS response-associated peptidase YedK
MTDAAADRGGLIQPTPPHHWCPRGRDAMGSKASLDGTSRRREVLSWSHHREVAALPPAEQDEWLDRAEAEKWDRNDLDGMPFRQMLQTMTQAFRKRDL